MELRRYSLLVSIGTLFFLFQIWATTTEARTPTLTILTHGDKSLLPLVYKRGLQFSRENKIRIRIYATDDTRDESSLEDFFSYVDKALSRKEPEFEFEGTTTLIKPSSEPWKRQNCSDSSECYLDNFKTVSKETIGPITGFIIDASWIPAFADDLQNITAKALHDERLDWDDIFPPQQSFVSYNDSIYAVPFDSDYLLLYYRTDVVKKSSKGSPPATWSDYVNLARQMYLTDMNDDRVPDYGSCISQQKGTVSGDRFLSFFVSTIQTVGTKQGAFLEFDPKTKELYPILDNDAFEAALDDWTDAAKYEQEEKYSSVNKARDIFLSGSCAVTIDSFQLAIKLQNHKYYASGRAAAIVTPGSDYALDRKSMRLVNCDRNPGICPTAEQNSENLNHHLPGTESGVNYAPYFYGGWSGAINVHEGNSSMKQLAYQFFAFMSYRSQSNDDTMEGLAFAPFRLSQVSPDEDCLERWERAGFDEDEAESLIQTIRNMVAHPNRVQGLSVPSVLKMKLSLENGVQNYRDNNYTLSATGEKVSKEWVSEISDLTLLQKRAYLASLDNNRIEVIGWFDDDDDSGAVLYIALTTALGSFVVLLLGVALLWRYRRHIKVLGIQRRDDRDDEALIALSKNGWKIDPGMIKITQKIATTSHGDVYRGKYEGLDVSVTKINPGLIGEETRLQLITELALVSELRHNNILHIHGGCMDPPNILVVSELTSKNLYDVIHSEEVRLPARLAHSFAADIARGMDYLHSSTPPIIHANLSPSNVLVDKKWNVKITNFSDYKLFEVAGARQKSLPWVAPEVLRGAEPTEKSDVYSFGITLWELLSRKHPYDNMHPQVVLISVQDGLRPYVPPTWKKPLVKLIESCWNSDPQRRPTFKEIRSRLSSIDPGWMKPSFPSSIASQFNLAALAEEPQVEDENSRSSKSIPKSFSKVIYPQFTGEITVLYTNIYGYNVLWRESPQDMEQAVAIHNELLRGIINGAGGFVARCDCDSFMALFTDHVAAVKCALKAQEELLGAPWPKGILTSPLAREQRQSGGQLLFRGLRVRMGVNSGELSDKLHSTNTLDFSDKILSNTGKITALAQGGEILIAKRTFRRIKHKLRSLDNPYVCDVRVEKGGHKVYRILPLSLEGRFSIDFEDSYSLNFPTASSIVHSPSLLSLRSDEDLESPRLPISPNSAQINSAESMSEPLLQDSTSTSPPSVAPSYNPSFYPSYNTPFNRSYNPSFNRSYNPSFNAASYLPGGDSYPASFNPAASFNPQDGGAPSWTMERYQVPFEQLKIEKKIGEGSFGEVYKAKWRGTTVAVKRFFRQQATDQILLELRKESVIMSELRHPNIILFLGVCLTPPNLCIISEYMRNGCVGKYLRNRSHNLTWSLRLNMLNQVATAMAYLHSFNPPVIHRDLSSYNLLVDDDMTVKVADFGLSRIKACNATMTQCGTAAWTAPEILDGLSYSETTDVYSFAIILWEFLTRKKPFKGQTVTTISQQVISGVRPTLPEDAPGFYVALIRECWTADPSIRPSFEAISQRLEVLSQEVETNPW